MSLSPDIVIGPNQRMRAIFEYVALIGPGIGSVLLTGESGTGKEVVANAIHMNSPRRNRPFVPVSCALFADTLIESELFGHERGAFTGAIAARPGRFERADGGTVFLDEIGEMTPPLQAKLLRFLEEKTFRRVGGSADVQVDVRVIAATNRDLEAAIQHATFREDLYFRLNVVSLTMPPLRDRRDDLPLLASYFVRQHASRCKRDVKGIAKEARKLLMAYDWPGNVRELSNAIERAVVLGSQDVILPEDLPEAIVEAGGGDVDAGFHSQVADRKRDIISTALERSGGNVARAARELSLQPTYLHRLIRTLGVRTG